jgi:hypothetical protein
LVGGRFAQKSQMIKTQGRKMTEYNHRHEKGQKKDRAEEVRFYWQMPNRVISTLAISEGMVVGDLKNFTMKLS